MSEYHHLIGADDVRAGGNAVERGAESMRGAAGTIDDAARRIETAAQLMAESVARFEMIACDPLVRAYLAAQVLAAQKPAEPAR